MNDDWFLDRVLPALGMACIALCAAVLVGLIADGAQSYRARPAEIACRVRGLDHERLPFRAAVTCVPRAGNAVDTVIVRVPR